MKIAAFFVGVAVLSLTACGGSSSDSKSPRSLKDDINSELSDLEDAEDEEYQQLLRDLESIENDFKADLAELNSPTDEDDDLSSELATDDFRPQPSTSSDGEDDPESNWHKTKDIYKSAKHKMNTKKDEWVADHRDQIDEAKGKGRDLKSKAKKKIGGMLDRLRDKLED